MRLYDEWKDEEIEKMKIAFLNGQKIKIIARDLGRTPSALNKALSRFGIRTSKQLSRHSVKWDNCISLNKNILNEQTIKIKLPIKTQENILYSSVSSTYKKTLFKNEPLWVSLKKVIEFLEKNGHKVEKIDPSKSFNKNVLEVKLTYLLDGKPITTSKLLLLANKLRLEKHKQIFIVGEVSC